jgi:hypothetical protein
MNKRAVVFIFVVCIAPALLRAQQAKPSTIKPPVSPATAQTRPASALNTPEEVVREWFRRWNALDGSEASIKRLIELYEPTGVNQIPPSDRQVGPVYMEGPEGVRKLAEDFTKSWMLPADRIDKTTADGKSTELFFKTQGPWGGPAIGVQYTQNATDRATKKRYSLPAFAVFHIENGKIRYARFYATRIETREE